MTYTLASPLFSDPGSVRLGITELMLNAVEHGNLEPVRCQEKRIDRKRANGMPEVKRRLGLPQPTLESAPRLPSSASRARSHSQSRIGGEGFRLAILFQPRRSAARSFSLRPPMGSTRPRRVISPVMATSRRTGMPVGSGDDRGYHGDTSRRPILGCRALRHVHMDVLLVEHRRLNAEGDAPATVADTERVAQMP